MREAEHGLQHANQGLPGGALLGLGSVLRAILQLHLGELDVPVAILVPDQLVDRFGGQVEAISREVGCNLRFRLLHAALYPSISD